MTRASQKTATKTPLMLRDDGFSRSMRRGYEIDGTGTWETPNGGVDPPDPELS
jgi:hypothetical protein